MSSLTIGYDSPYTLVSSLWEPYLDDQDKSFLQLEGSTLQSEIGC